MGVMQRLFRWLYAKTGHRYIWLGIVFEVWTALIICLATLGLFSLYEPISKDEFWELLAFSEGCVLLALVYVIRRTKDLARPINNWIKGGRDPAGALDAWRRAVAYPRDFVVRNGWQPFVMVALPISVFATYKFELPIYTAGIIFAGAVISVAYSAILHFFAAERALRPVIEDIARRLPSDFAGLPVGVPLRWKLLGALPLINVITGVVVSGLSTDGTATLRDLGVDVVVAVVVAFTISLELTVLVTKSVLTPVDDLLAATERVKQGDLSARVPILAGDEMGSLAGSFNEMMRGLEEREKLREAFGSYVDPQVAERVLEEGEMIQGQEVEVSVVFVDIRDFTAFAERSSAEEVVAYLNDFFGLSVPIVLKHGGHANKFVGDGMLCVFGAPQPHRDHADRAVAAACEIAREVKAKLGDRCRVGIGINSGPVMVGSVGGGGRLDFAVIGDPVNVAARVEKATRETGDTILLTRATECLLERRDVELEERGAVELRGKSEPVPLYAPVLEVPAPASSADGDGAPAPAEASRADGAAATAPDSQRTSVSST
jgi:adenylate cyclase